MRATPPSTRLAADDALRDWRRVETMAMADGARGQIEVLWINPACAITLDREHLTPLDAWIKSSAEACHERTGK